MHAEEHTLTLAGSPAFYRSAPTDGPPAVYLHDAPTDSADWEALLERTGGLAVDLPGFGRSGKGGHLDYSPAGLASFVEALLDELGARKLSLVGHGWGAAVASLLAARNPERVLRLVLIDAAPPLGGEPWHRLARVWRTPVAGELAMGAINRPLLGRILRRASVSPDAWTSQRIRAVWEQFDQGTQRATLRLHRAASPDTADAISEALGTVGMPSLLLWGQRDPWFPPALAAAWASRLPQVTVEPVPEAGHWPWIDRPEVSDRIAAFLAAG